MVVGGHHGVPFGGRAKARNGRTVQASARARALFAAMGNPGQRQTQHSALLTALPITRFATRSA
jgi:hypothetical protein